MKNQLLLLSIKIRDETGTCYTANLVFSDIREGVTSKTFY